MSRLMWSKQLHRDSVNHRGVLVRWTSRQPGRTSRGKASSSARSAEQSTPALGTIWGLAVAEKQNLLCPRESQRFLEGGCLSHRVGMCPHSRLPLCLPGEQSLPAGCAGRGLPDGGRDGLSVCPRFRRHPGIPLPRGAPEGPLWQSRGSVGLR